jgi:Flp pilus assembly protein TadG
VSPDAIRAGLKRLRLRDDRGSVALEFALIAPALFLLIFGLIDVARVFGMQNRIMSAARQGARFASVQTDPLASAQAIRDVVKNAAIPFGGPAVTDAQVTVTVDTAAHRVTVSVVNYSLAFITPFASTVGKTGVSLSAQAVLGWERGS